MAMRRGDLVLLDTNVLLSATVDSRADSVICREIFSLAPRSGVHFVSIGQIYREYLVVATRVAERNGLGLQSSEALHNIREFCTRMHLLPETREVVAELRRLVERHLLESTRIHDANLVAAMLVHNVPTLVTANTADFAAFTGIAVCTPDEAARELRAL